MGVTYIHQIHTLMKNLECITFQESYHFLRLFLVRIICFPISASIKYNLLLASVFNNSPPLSLFLLHLNISSWANKSSQKTQGIQLPVGFSLVLSFKVKAHARETVSSVSSHVPTLAVSTLVCVLRYVLKILCVSNGKYALVSIYWGWFRESGDGKKASEKMF